MGALSTENFRQRFNECPRAPGQQRRAFGTQAPRGNAPARTEVGKGALGAFATTVRPQPSCVQKDAKAVADAANEALMFELSDLRREVPDERSDSMIVLLA